MTIRDELKLMLAQIKQVEPETIDVHDDDDFMTTLGIDSLDAVELTIEIGERFGFVFGEDIDDINALQSFGSLIQLTNQRMTSSTSI